MRGLRAAIACGLTALCVAPASPALATSLKGKPFVIDPAFDGFRYYSSIFAYGDGFAASLAQSAEGGLPDKLYFKAFTASGGVRIGKTLAAEGVKGQDGAAQILGAGGLELNNGRASVAYLDLYRSPKNQQTVGGLFAQAVAKNGKPTGGELTLDDAKRDIVPSGYVISLARKRGLAFWTVQDAEGGETSFGRFIRPNGKPGPANIDLTLSGSTLLSVSQFGQGFVTLHRKLLNQAKASLFGQVHDSDGQKVGRPGALMTREELDRFRAFAIAGLGGGKIVALNTVYTGTATNLVGQIYDGDWNKVGRERILMKGLFDGRYSFSPLPGGDFLVASVFERSGSQRIELRRFDQKLKQVGDTAATDNQYKIEVSQLLTLQSGAAVISYEYSKPEADYIYTLVGQVINP